MDDTRLPQQPAAHSPTAQDTLELDIVVPVFNEQETLEQCVTVLHGRLASDLTESWRITIADNASTDDTPAIADMLAERFAEVIAVHLPLKGRGRALKTVWSDSPARVLVYLDEDLSTGLEALRPLVAPLLSGHSDLAIGTRLSRGSRVVRGGRREFISRGYNLMLRAVLGTHFSDAQCGFKAIRADIARRLLPLVEDTGWFFDTELLVLAERSGLRIHEVPVDWIDDSHSSVDIVATARADIKGTIRVGLGLARGRIPVDGVYQAVGRHPYTRTGGRLLLMQLIAFGVVGVLSTLAYALVYLLFAAAWPAQLANAAALLVTTVANTAVNRRFTFGVRGRAHAAAHQAQGLVVFGIAWGMTAGALAVLHAADPAASTFATVAVLTVANLAATLLRFLLLRFWVFRAPRDDAPQAQPPERFGIDHVSRGAAAPLPGGSAPDTPSRPALIQEANRP